MEDRKDFLTILKECFGSCDRKSFLQKLRDFFSSPAEQTKQDNPTKEPEVSQPEVEAPRIIDINGTDAWRNHVDCLRDVSSLDDCISKSKILLKRASMAPFAKSVTTSLTEIPVYVDKHFKEPIDINEDTSEQVARQTGKLVKEYIWDLLRGCHSGIKHSQGTEKKFYETFCQQMEEYLSSICVYRKNITVGMDVRTNAKWFETPFIRGSSIASCIGTIDEIEVAPHFIPYRDDDGSRDELILKGVCIAFGDTRRK